MSRVSTLNSLTYPDKSIATNISDFDFLHEGVNRDAALLRQLRGDGSAFREIGK